MSPKSGEQPGTSVIAKNSSAAIKNIAKPCSARLREKNAATNVVTAAKNHRCGIFSLNQDEYVEIVCDARKKKKPQPAKRKHCDASFQLRFLEIKYPMYDAMNGAKTIAPWTDAESDFQYSPFVRKSINPNAAITSDESKLKDSAPRKSILRCSR